MNIKEIKILYFYIHYINGIYVFRSLGRDLFQVKNDKITFISDLPQIEKLKDGIEYIKDDLIKMCADIMKDCYCNYGRSEYESFGAYFIPIFRKIKLEELLNDI